VWNEGHRSLARLHYTLAILAKLGKVKLDQVHAKIFNEIHVNGNSLIGADPSDAAAAELVQIQFIKTLGIDESEFKNIYHGPAVEAALQRADQLVRGSRITHVPAFVINGQYVVDVASAGGPERVMPLVEELAAQAHRQK
jgi:thiol:disulfide interchange protein DsbA